MAHNAQYYSQRKEEIRQKSIRAWQKYYQVCKMVGEEYIALNERLGELQRELQELEKKEQESKKQEKKDEDSPKK
jgi:hypothetical protein